MPAHFLDSSGLVKRYIREAGTGWVRYVCATAALDGLYIAQIAGVETVAAVARRVRQGATTPGDGAAAIATLKHQLISDYAIVGITDALLQRAMDLVEKHGLRGYDAVQLASALQVKALRQASGLSSLAFVSADAHLNAAAAAEGLAVDDPNAHP